MTRFSKQKVVKENQETFPKSQFEKQCCKVNSNKEKPIIIERYNIIMEIIDNTRKRNCKIEMIANNGDCKNIQICNSKQKMKC